MYALGASGRYGGTNCCPGQLVDGILQRSRRKKRSVISLLCVKIREGDKHLSDCNPLIRGIIFGETHKNTSRCQLLSFLSSWLRAYMRRVLVKSWTEAKMETGPAVYATRLHGPPLKAHVSGSNGGPVLFLQCQDAKGRSWLDSACSDPIACRLMADVKTSFGLALAPNERSGRFPSREHRFCEKLRLPGLWLSVKRNYCHQSLAVLWKNRRPNHLSRLILDVVRRSRPRWGNTVVSLLL